MGLLLLMGGAGSTAAAPLLLDTYSATVAYSLRKLRNAYSGSAIRVRRSSDSAEQDIGFTGNNLDTASMLSFCGAGDGFVATWYDQVGSNNATQTTAANQPKIVSSGATVVNEFSKPAINVVDSSGASVMQRLELSNFYTASQSYVGFFSVYSLQSNGGFPSIVQSSPFDRGFISLHSGGDRIVRTFTIRSASSGGNGATLSLNSTTVRHDSADRSKLYTYLNTTAAASIDLSDSNTDFLMPTNTFIGNANNAAVTSNILISEFIGFTTSQASNQLTIRTNQSDYWRA